MSIMSSIIRVIPDVPANVTSEMASWMKELDHNLIDMFDQVNVCLDRKEEIGRNMESAIVELRKNIIELKKEITTLKKN